MDLAKTIGFNMKLITDLVNSAAESGQPIDTQTAMRVIELYSENQTALIDGIKALVDDVSRLNNELLQERMKNIRLQLLHQVP